MSNYSYNTEKAVEAQRNLCRAREVPMFAPANGICTRCGKDIYSKGGYSVGRASISHITGCPFCHRSFVD